MTQKLADHLSPDALLARYESSTRPVEQRRWHALWLKSQDRSTADIAAIVHRHPDWVRRIVRTYNQTGPDSVRDRRVDNGSSPMLSEERQEALREALSKPPDDQGLWTSAKVAAWIAHDLGREHVPTGTGWEYLQRLKFSPQLPRPAHAKSDRQAQERLKKGDLSEPETG